MENLVMILACFILGNQWFDMAAKADGRWERRITRALGLVVYGIGLYFIVAW